MRVSSAAIASTCDSTHHPRTVRSARFPIGVATTYNAPGASACCATPLAATNPSPPFTGSSCMRQMSQFLIACLAAALCACATPAANAPQPRSAPAPSAGPPSTAATPEPPPAPAGPAAPATAAPVPLPGTTMPTPVSPAPPSEPAAAQEKPDEGPPVAVALLLPGQGTPFARAAEAVRLGFFAAHGVANANVAVQLLEIDDNVGQLRNALGA